MKKRNIILGGALCAFLIAGCGKTAAPAETNAPAEEGK